MTDQELTNGLIAGHTSAYRELVEKFQERVIRTCYSFVHNQQDAEDLAQEVFLEVFHSVVRFRGRSGLGTWIYRIAVNKSLNYVRKSKQYAFLERLQNIFNNGIVAEPAIEPPSEIEDESENRRRILHQAIDLLPKKQRTAFLLHKYEEMPYKEIAGVMNITLPAVESLMHRAKSNLQDSILRLTKKSHP